MFAAVMADPSGGGEPMDTSVSGGAGDNVPLNSQGIPGKSYSMTSVCCR